MKRKKCMKEGQKRVVKQRKKAKGDGNDNSDCLASVSHPVLQCYFSRVTSLRQYILEKSSKSAKWRLQRVKSIGHSASSAECRYNLELTSLLDTTLVACDNRDETGSLATTTLSDLKAYTQHVQHSSDETSLSPDVSQSRQLSDLVDSCIHALFRRHAANYRPQHLLCQAYQYASAPGRNGFTLSVGPGVAGIVSIYPNPRVEILKGRLWSDLLCLLGKEGETILRQLLMDCYVFIPIQGGQSRYKQLSGRPLSELKPRSESKSLSSENSDKQRSSFSAIRFVRNRMFYAKPSLNGNGDVRIGLKKIHVLNSWRDITSIEQTLHIMKYIFPRQFNLHNVFTSEINPKETAQNLKDYTTREMEIRQSFGKNNSLPRRLRGLPFGLIHYCSVNRSIQFPHVSSPSGISDRSFIELACSPHSVSAFCKAVISKVVPSELFGIGEAKIHHKRKILHVIDQFVKMRKFESPTLLQVIECIKISEMPWLVPAKCKTTDRMSKSDYNKRKEIFLEFIYWLFDSFLIPLIRSFFYVTESSAHRYQLFYFRHDVWKKYAEPSIASLKLSMFQKVKDEKATKMLEGRHLTYSQVRLLPKATGVRPIINLRRRVPIKINGKISLSRSINSVLKPLFSVLNFEKTQIPERLGSSLFSVEDIFHRLRDFKYSLPTIPTDKLPFYFVKVDVKSCFDTIPQEKLLQLLQSVVSKRQYKICRRIEILPPNKHEYHNKDTFSKKPAMKYYYDGRAAGHPFGNSLQENSELSCKPATIIVDAVSEQIEQRENLLALLYEHVQRNIVKFGKQYFRQVTGVPQGSVLSTLLCSFFYADMERTYLNFLSDGSSLLLRLIDDFLLITTKKRHAVRFFEIMHEGIPEYGLSIKSEKTKTNFDVHNHGDISYDTNKEKFPYCGILIDTKTLDLSKDVERRTCAIQNSLTVDFSRAPGQILYRKTMNALKIQMHAMLLDTSYNSVTTVLSNLYSCFLETADKFFRYMKSLPVNRRPTTNLMIKTIRDVVTLAQALMRHKGKQKEKWKDYECHISHKETRFFLEATSSDRNDQDKAKADTLEYRLAFNAFEAVLRPKQTGYQHLLRALESEKDGVMLEKQSVM